MFRRPASVLVPLLVVMRSLLGGSLRGADEIPTDSSPVESERLVVRDGPDVDGLDSFPVALRPGSPEAESDWAQFAAQVPNFAVSAAGPSSFGAVFALRGLANTPYFSDPAVGVYFDAIPLGGAFSYPSDFSGFASATVYAGPQPTGFGRAAEAGAIVFNPAPAGNYLTAGFDVGNYQARSLSLLASGTEGAASDSTVAISLGQRSGYIENTEIGVPADRLRAFSGFLRQRYSPSPACRISLEVLGDTHRDGAAPLVPLQAPLRTVERAKEGATDTNLAGVALTADFDTAVGILSETTSATRSEINPYADWLVLPPPLQSVIEQHQDALNQELRLASRGGGPSQWDLGAWFSSGTTAGSSDRSIKGVVPIEVSDYGYARRETSAFAKLVTELAAAWSLSFGLRAESITKDYHQEEAVPTPDLHFRLDRADRALLPALKLSFSQAGRPAAWAGLSLGTKPGGFAAYTDNPVLIPFSPETALAFEAGAQRSLLAGKVRLALHAFDYEIRNYQIERSFSPTDYFVADAPNARSTGAEFDAAWRPDAGWTFSLDGGIDRVLLLRFSDPLSGAREDGARAPFSPAYSLGTGARYESSFGWFAVAQASAFGRTYYSEAENSVYSQPAYLTLGFRAGLERRRWRITGFIQNATNRSYYTLIIPGVNSGAPGAPLTYGTEFMLKL